MFAVPASPDADLSAQIAAFADDVVAPTAAAMAVGIGPTPREVIAAAGESGVAGVLVPRRWGGQGHGHHVFTQLIGAVARRCASTAVILDVHVSVATEPIVVFGNDEQRERYLPRLAAGEWVGAFALTEPGSGSDAGALTTRARRVGDTYVLSGTKTFITNAGAADLYVVMARTGGERGSITAFLVEAAWPGVHAGTPFHKMGLAGSWTSEVVFDNVVVPTANRLGPEGSGLQIALSALDSGRIGISAQAIGVAQGALEDCLALGGNAIGDDPRIADMEVRIQAGRALVAVAAGLVDRGEPATRAASIAKLWTSDSALTTCLHAIDICAPDSARHDHPAAIRLRDVRATTIYEGTNQVQRIVIARDLLRGAPSSDR